MAVITKYVVERSGVEKMTFTSKAEADAYDKMLDTADALQLLLSHANVLTEENQVEALALYLAQQKDELLIALGVKKAAKVTEKSSSEAAEPAAKAKKLQAVVAEQVA
jgi:hypothetical protein